MHECGQFMLERGPLAWPGDRFLLCGYIPSFLLAGGWREEVTEGVFQSLSKRIISRNDCSAIMTSNYPPLPWLLPPHVITLNRIMQLGLQRNGNLRGLQHNL